MTIRVTDDFLGRGGTFRLVVTHGAGSVEPTGGEPDVTLQVADLGSLYLGRPSAIPRWHAGRIEGTAEAVTQLDRLFRTATLPFCSEVF